MQGGSASQRKAPRHKGRVPIGARSEAPPGTACPPSRRAAAPRPGGTGWKASPLEDSGGPQLREDTGRKHLGDPGTHAHPAVRRREALRRAGRFLYRPDGSRPTPARRTRWCCARRTPHPRRAAPTASGSPVHGPLGSAPDRSPARCRVCRPSGQPPSLVALLLRDAAAPGHGRSAGHGVRVMMPGQLSSGPGIPQGPAPGAGDRRGRPPGGPRARRGG